MDEAILHVPQMIMIGSSGRNSGKTTLASSLIRQWKNHFCVIGLKVTSINEQTGKCPRGGEGCGICSKLKGTFELVEETNLDSYKDTSVLLASGAQKVYWLKTLKSHIYEGIKYFLDNAPEDTLIICESNSLRTIVKPGIFIMLKNTGSHSIKESAQRVMNLADLIIDKDFIDSMDLILKEITVDRSHIGLEVRKNTFSNTFYNRYSIVGDRNGFSEKV